MSRAYLDGLVLSGKRGDVNGGLFKDELFLHFFHLNQIPFLILKEIISEKKDLKSTQCRKKQQKRKNNRKK